LTGPVVRHVWQEQERDVRTLGFDPGHDVSTECLDPTGELGWHGRRGRRRRSVRGGRECRGSRVAKVARLSWTNACRRTMGQPLKPSMVPSARGERAPPPPAATGWRRLSEAGSDGRYTIDGVPPWQKREAR
jgi:hypothetical protein